MKIICILLFIKIIGFQLELAHGRIVDQESGLTPDDINDVFRENRDSIRHCYEKELEINSNTEGKIDITFTIGPEGNVLKSSIESNSTDSITLGVCFSNEIEKLKFPPSRNGKNVVVNYPLVVSPLIGSTKISANFSLGIGNFKFLGDYQPRKVNISHGTSMEVSGKGGINNFLMEFSAADTKQGNGSEHRFKSNSSHVNIGYLSFLYKRCHPFMNNSRVCAASGYGFLELIQANNTEIDGSVVKIKDSKYFGAIPIQISVSKIWPFSGKKGFGHYFQLSGSYLHAQGIELLSTTLAYGIGGFVFQ